METPSRRPSSQTPLLHFHLNAGSSNSCPARAPSPAPLHHSPARRDAPVDNANGPSSSISSLSRSSFAYVSIASPTLPSLSARHPRWRPHHRTGAPIANRFFEHRRKQAPAQLPIPSHRADPPEVSPPRHGRTNVLVTCPDYLSVAAQAGPSGRLRLSLSKHARFRL